ncbi:MAG: hypothetical protein IKH86_07730 [Prevotella sp.]|jgi:hypothetical protein|nr:hypothetical protein [Prevotella sp.]
MHRNNRQEDRYLKTRNILNTIFVVGAVIGMGIYFWGNRTVGTIVILVSMAIKMVECVLRFMK